MQLADHFDVLLKGTVNLSQFKLDTLDSRVTAIYNALKADSELGRYVRDKIPQGSWAHRTIINPVGGNEFDVDFMLLLDENPDWSGSPKIYIEKVYAALHRHSVYGGMPHSRKCRCVRLTYANSCHVDIVPYLKLSDGRQVIVNRDNDEWEDTDPEGFTAWMRDKDQIAGGNLRRVIRLMKYLRDHKNSFTGTRSVILTTLLGQQVSATMKLFDTGYYNSTPTALLHIVSDLDAWLQDRPYKPSVPDPSGSGVTFDHRWDQATYAYFRDRIHVHAAEMKDAYDEPDKNASVRKWQAIFGDGFTAPEPKSSTGRFGTVCSPSGDHDRAVRPGRVTKKTATPARLSTWQQQAIADLRAIAGEHPDTIKVIMTMPTVTDTHAFVTIQLPTKDLPPGPGGLRLRDHEDFIIGIRQSRLVPLQVDVDHQRFAGHPHVLQGHRLCIYLDPAREWDPLGGMPGFLERLWAWLSDAAAGRFNAATAMYHAVGGVLHLTVGTPTIVIREPVPPKPFQHARLLSRSAHRLDMTFASAPPPALVVPVLTLSSALPLGAGLTVTQLLQLMDQAGCGGPSGHTGLGPAPARAVLTSLATSASRNADGTHQYFTLAVPHPAGGPAHLLAGRLPVAASDQMRQLARTRAPILDPDPARLSMNIPIEWCRVSDERPEVNTRRDAQRPVNAFQGKTVLVWGCGGIGSWAAEFITRAGAANIRVCDEAIVTGGLLVRQDYVEADIGKDKAHALAARIRAISDRADVSTVTGTSPSDLEDAITCADVIIDATVSIAVGQALSAVAATERPHAVLAQLATDTSTGTLGILTVSAPSDPDGPAVIDTRAGRTVMADPALEPYHTLWREPLDEHELIPTRGCSVPTFHGSAADLAAVAACLVNLLAMHLATPVSGTHLIALPHAPGSGPHHRFIAA